MVYLVNIAFLKVVLRKKNLNIFGLKSMKIGEKTHFEIYSVFSRLLFVMLLQKRTNLPKLTQKRVQYSSSKFLHPFGTTNIKTRKNIHIRIVLRKNHRKPQRSFKFS